MGRSLASLRTRRVNTKRKKAMMELKHQVFSSLPQKLTICGRLYCVRKCFFQKNSSLYSSSDYSRRYPSEISFLTDQLALPNPVVHKFVMTKVSDYSNKLRVGLGRCHLEQKNYCFKFDGQIQVGTIDHFLIEQSLAVIL